MLHLITPILQLDYPEWRRSESIRKVEEFWKRHHSFTGPLTPEICFCPKCKTKWGEDCAICGQDSWTCEHSEEINQASGEYETEAERNQ